MYEDNRSPGHVAYACTNLMIAYDARNEYSEEEREIARQRLDHASSRILKAALCSLPSPIDAEQLADWLADVARKVPAVRRLVMESEARRATN